MTIMIQNKGNVSICTQRVSVQKACTKSIQYSLKCQSADAYCRHDRIVIYALGLAYFASTSVGNV